MSTDSNPRLSALLNDVHVFQFPASKGWEQLQPPDFVLPQDVIVDPYNGLFCIICQASVPRSEGNASQHVIGKRHMVNEKRLVNGVLTRKDMLRERFIEAAKTQRAILCSQPHAPCNPNTQNASIQQTSDVPSEINSVSTLLTNTPMSTNISHLTTINASSNTNNSEAAVITSVAMMPNPEKELPEFKANSGDRTQSEVSLRASYDPQTSPELSSERDKKKLREERLNFAEQVLSDSKFDAEDYLQRVLAGKDDSLSEKSDDSEEPGDTDSGFGRYTSRRRPSSTFEYKAPDNMDNSLDFMVPETSRKDFTGQVSGLSSKSKRVPMGNSLMDSDLHGGSGEGKVQFIPIRSREDEETKGDLYKGRRNRWISQNGLLVLHDNNGEELPPWLLTPTETDNVLYSADSSVALHFEILQFEKFVSPTKIEIQARNEVIMTVESITKKLWPESSLHIFGSVATNLALPSSDVDITIMGTPKSGAAAEFDILANAVRNISGFAKRVQVIRAKVPLVKIISRSSGMNCDVSIGVGNGVENVPRIRGFLEQYPALRPLLLVVKCILHQRGLNDVYTGGLGSYAILLMLVSHLQMAAYNFPKTKSNLGTQLQQFFELYGEMWNPCLSGIQIRDGGMYYDKFERFGSTPFETSRFSIEDPNDATNEVARNSFGTAKIRAAFQSASRCLLRWRRDDASTSPTPLGALIFTEYDFLKRRRVVIEDLERQGVCVLRESVGEGLTYNTDEMGAAGSSKSVLGCINNVNVSDVNDHMDVIQDSRGSNRGIQQRREQTRVVDGATGNMSQTLNKVTQIRSFDPSREISFSENQRRSMMGNGGNHLLHGSESTRISGADAAAVAHVSMLCDGAEHVDDGVVFPSDPGNGVVGGPMTLPAAVQTSIIQPSAATTGSSVHGFNPELGYCGGSDFIHNSASVPVDISNNSSALHLGARGGRRGPNSAVQFRGRNSFRKSLRRGKRGGVTKQRR